MMFTCGACFNSALLRAFNAPFTYVNKGILLLLFLCILIIFRLLVPVLFSTILSYPVISSLIQSYPVFLSCLKLFLLFLLCTCVHLLLYLELFYSFVTLSVFLTFSILRLVHISNASSLFTSLNFIVHASDVCTCSATTEIGLSDFIFIFIRSFIYCFRQ